MKIIFTTSEDPSIYGKIASIGYIRRVDGEDKWREINFAYDDEEDLVAKLTHSIGLLNKELEKGE